MTAMLTWRAMLRADLCLILLDNISDGHPCHQLKNVTSSSARARTNVVTDASDNSSSLAGARGGRDLKTRTLVPANCSAVPAARSPKKVHEPRSVRCSNPLRNNGSAFDTRTSRKFAHLTERVLHRDTRPQTLKARVCALTLFVGVRIVSAPSDT